MSTLIDLRLAKAKLGGFHARAEASLGACSAKMCDVTAFGARASFAPFRVPWFAGLGFAIKDCSFAVPNSTPPSVIMAFLS